MGQSFEIDWLRLGEKSNKDLRKTIFTNKNNTILKKEFKAIFFR